MKDLISFLLVSIAIFLVSCNSNTSAVIENISSDGKVKIKVEGKRGLPLDPYKTEISVKAYDFKEGKLMFEIMAGDLNNESVKFTWEDNSNCIISIEESDKHVRSFKLFADENQVQLAEI
ncbi:MAG: hypothetical protein V4615_01050 [Bacteroidota bacterium]